MVWRNQRDILYDAQPAAERHYHKMLMLNLMHIHFHFKAYNDFETLRAAECPVSLSLSVPAGCR